MTLLAKAIKKAERALKGNSNDAEHDALVALVAAARNAQDNDDGEAESEICLEYKDVTVYCTNDRHGMVSGFWFTLTLNGEEFDVRDLPSCPPGYGSFQVGVELPKWPIIIDIFRKAIDAGDIKAEDEYPNVLRI